MPHTQTFLWLITQSILPNVSVKWRRKAYYTGKEGYAATQASENETLIFTKKEELVYNSIYSFKPIVIGDMKWRGTEYKKIVLLVLVLVRVKFF